VGGALLWAGLILQAAGLEDQFEIPAGFRVRRVADEELCGGSYDITFDGAGRLLVGDGTGVRRLIDRDGDGRYDAYERIADGLGPRGPQGLLVIGDRLFAVGGDGLQLYSGAAGTGSLKHEGRLGAPFNTGGDHAAHALVRGHDDWIYFVVGDGSGVEGRRHITEPTSPCAFERAGSVFRISPDGRRWECVGRGGRNAPNLGINALADLFSLDSDMEWHVGTPWWRPVRLNHWIAGADQGWQSVNAHPPYFPDSLPGIDDVGRGSPDWGVFYEHAAFPERYRDAYFVCDYRAKSATTGGYTTCGRLLVFFLERRGGGWNATHEIFAIPKPGAKDADGRPIDFALVGIAVAPDGSLFVSDHGRGIWRIYYDPRLEGPPPIVPASRPLPKDPDKLLDELLRLPQPQSEHSRLRREAIREALGDAFDARLSNVARAGSIDVRLRLAALRALTAWFETIPSPLLEQLAQDASEEIRYYAAWLIGLQGRREGASFLAARLEREPAPFVRRRILEALTRNPPAPGELTGLIACLESEDPWVGRAAMVALSRQSADDWFERAQSGPPRTRIRAEIAARMGEERPRDRRLPDRIAALLRDCPPADRLELLRVLGLAREEIVRSERTASAVEQFLRDGAADTDTRIRWEAVRLIGAYRSDAGFAPLLDLLERERDPVSQFHIAQALTRIRPGRTQRDERRVVDWFIGAQRGWFSQFDGKGHEFPAFWGTVLAEFTDRYEQALMSRWEEVDLGSPLGPHVLRLLAATKDGADRIIRTYGSRPEPEVRARLLAVLGEARGAAATDFLIQELRTLQDARLRAAALVSLARRKPSPEARFFLTEGLRHEEGDVANACARALARYEPDRSADLCRLLITRMRDRRDLFRDFERLLRVQSGKPADEESRESPEDPERRERLASWERWYRREFGRPFEPDRPKTETLDDEELLAFLLSDDARGGDARRGRPIYEALCARCHGGTDLGGIIFGPDLTGVTRRLPRREIAEAIVYPSRVVAERYQATLVELDDGTARTGFITQKDETTVTLADLTGVHRLERPRIRSIATQKISLMPERLLYTLGREKIRDLMAFLEEVGTRPEK
jgi:putative heme-binding domain-containing protein